MDAISSALEHAYKTLAPVADRERSEQERLRLTMMFVERTAGPYRGKRVLELGSSLGLQLVAAKELGAAEARGVDKFIFPEAGKNAFYVSPEDMTVLERGWSAGGVSIQRHDLAEPLPFADGSFDLVICNAVLEHLHGIHKFVFTEAHRVLTPGGSFVFTTPNLASLLKRVRFCFGRSPMWDIKDYFDSGSSFTGHTREFTIAECRAMLARSGFEPVSLTSRPAYFRWDWLKNPRKAHNVLFQLASRLWPTWGDLIFAAGRKK